MAELQAFGFGTALAHRKSAVEAGQVPDRHDFFRHRRKRRCGSSNG
jgi:uncharacterized short protein YbdD (DUF466 family)